MNVSTIWKFSLQVTGEQSIQIPKGANFLSLQVQNGTPCLWFLCNPKAEREMKLIAVYGTGHIVANDELKYLGSFQLLEGNFVGHVFERVSSLSTHRESEGGK